VQDALAFIDCAFERGSFVAVLFLYCDESGKYRKDPVVSISGVGATSARLAKFSTEWETLLRSYGIGEELHMSRVAQLSQACGHRMPAGQTIDERIEVLKPFADCINHHCEIGLIQAWDVKGYNCLSLEAQRSLGGSNDPYQLAFIRDLLGVLDYLGVRPRIAF
jgi:hypothetical protein